MRLAVCTEKNQLNEAGKKPPPPPCTSYISAPLTLASDHLPFIEKYLFSIDKRIQIMVKRQICRWKKRKKKRTRRRKRRIYTTVWEKLEKKIYIGFEWSGMRWNRNQRQQQHERILNRHATDTHTGWKLKKAEKKKRTFWGGKPMTKSFSRSRSLLFSFPSSQITLCFLHEICEQYIFYIHFYMSLALCMYKAY